MIRKRRAALGLGQPAPDSSQRFTSLWIQGVSALIAVAVGIVTIQSSALSPVWRTLLLSLAVLLVLGLALPPLARAVRQAWSAQVFSFRLRGSWKSFRHEVDERRWLYTSMHAHSLTTLLMALRASPPDEEGRVRLRVLQSAVACCASLDGIRHQLDQLVDGRWTGVTAARAEIGLFESLIALPDAAGWLRELTTLRSTVTDGTLIAEWLERYRGSLAAYGRWARDRNRELGEKVFREHFL